MGGIPRPFRPVGIVSGETPGILPQRMPGRRGGAFDRLLRKQPASGEGTRLPEPACQPTGAAGTHAIETRTGGYAPRTVHEKKPLRFVRSGHRENMTRGYFVTRSSQRTIESMTSIDMPQAATKTHHVAHIGVCM